MTDKVKQLKDAINKWEEDEDNGEFFWEVLMEEEYSDAHKAKEFMGKPYEFLESTGVVADGQILHIAFKWDGVLFAQDYYYSSWDSSEPDYDGVYEAESYTQTITRYRKKSEKTEKAA